MNRDYRLFYKCVESMRTAEKKFEEDPTPFNKSNMEKLQNKVDGWIVWFHEKEKGNTKASVPPFIGKAPRRDIRE